MRHVLFVVLVAACATNPSSSGGTNTGGDTGGGGGGSNTGGGGGGSNTGGGGGSNTGGGGGSLSATDFLAQMDQKYCAEAFTCMASFPAMTGDTFADEFGASAQECESDSASYEMPAMVEAEITAGKIHYDAAAAAQCVAGITNPAACSDFWTNGLDYPAACDTAMVGTIADGAACVVDFDCSNPDSYCETGKCTVDTGN